MKLSSLTRRIREKSTATQGAEIDPWAVHKMATERASRGEAITLLSIGQEVDEQTPPLIVDAAVTSLRAGRHHYADVRGEERLRSAIASYHTRLTGQKADSSMVTVFAGAQNALFSIAQVLLEPEDEVILIAPYYTTYQATFGAPGPTVTSVEVDASTRYELDVAHLLDQISDKTQVVVINAPNNPLGSRYSSTQLEAIVRKCIQHNVWLVMDAVYLDIVSPDSIDLPHTIAGIEDILITVGSVSKSHRMTGWRMGWAVTPTSLSEHLYNLSVCMHYGLPPFIQDAAIAALELAADTPPLVRATLDTRRQIAMEVLVNSAPANVIDPEQGMFILIDVEPLDTTAYNFAVALLKATDVSVLPCDGFGPGGRYLVRIGLCVDGDELRDACRKITGFIASYRSDG